MRRPPARSTIAQVAALLAVALLTLAGVRSTVMQASEGLGAAPMCAAMTSGGHMRSAPGKARHAACEFCAAAAHVPVQSQAPTLPAPTAVAWFTPAPASGLGPRGPPAFRANARAPPAVLS